MLLLVDKRITFTFCVLHNYVVMEFIYAQSPVYMKGLLLGCFFFMQGIAVVLGSLLFLSQSKGNSKYWEHFKSFSSYYTYKNNSRWCDIKEDEIHAGSCITAYSLTTIVIVFGIIIFLYSARKYRIRIRGSALKYFLQFLLHVL